MALWDLVSNNMTVIYFIFAKYEIHYTFGIPLPKFSYFILFHKVFNLYEFLLLLFQKFDFHF